MEGKAGEQLINAFALGGLQVGPALRVDDRLVVGLFGYSVMMLAVAAASKPVNRPPSM
jgi:hypothetical protein